MICVCYVLIEVLGLLGFFVVVVGLVYVYKVYFGDLFWFINIDWFNKDVELKVLVLKVYRCVIVMLNIINFIYCLLENLEKRLEWVFGKVLLIIIVKVDGWVYCGIVWEWKLYCMF